MAPKGYGGSSEGERNELIMSNESDWNIFLRWSKGFMPLGPTIFMRNSSKIVVAVARGAKQSKKMLFGEDQQREKTSFSTTRWAFLTSLILKKSQGVGLFKDMYDTSRLRPAPPPPKAAERRRSPIWGYALK